MNAQVKLGFDFYNVLDFARGEVDCLNSNGAKKDQTEEYYDGYGHRYTLEAMADQEVTHG
ncbi:MAG: hypothetical protein ACR2PP_04410 [Psychrobacter sp.]